MSFRNSLILALLACVCLVVIFETEYFFIEADSKFKAYISLKDSAMFVQSIPCRLLLVYLINTDKILHDEPMVEFPESFYRVPVEEAFSLEIKLASQ